MPFKTHQAPNGRHYRAWTEGVLWEPQAKEQAERLLELPFVKELVVMPDTHFGFGGPVGVGVRFEGAVIPSVIGVDIGCGMRAVRTDLTVDDVSPSIRPEIRRSIEATVPAGLTRGVDRGSWSNVPEYVKLSWLAANSAKEPSLADEYEDLLSRFDGPGNLALLPLESGHTAQHRNPLSQLGTLGTGNHFFEVSADEEGAIWLVVHSGSRGAGARIGDYFTRRAQELMKKWLVKLPGDDKNLAFIPRGENEYLGYIAFMKWAQRYAHLSRLLMMSTALNELDRIFRRRVKVYAAFDIHHNYLDTDTMVARKGAVHLTSGECAIIPGAMGARTYIVLGQDGLKDSLFTCSHGAGRAMSRTAATKTVSMEKHQADLSGLECDRSTSTLDETPSAYKDIDAVINAQADLIKPVHTLTALVCVKGVGETRQKKSPPAVI